ncbi:MAG: riboflavin synthase [Myxococcales bacterium]|nr:riboflavin synthase [Myxococcales bacterium]
MFTGIIEAVGRVVSISTTGEDARIVISASWPDGDYPGVALGDSVAINGTCLTVVRFTKKINELTLDFDASHETMALTSLGALSTGDKVNMERALRVGDRLGGHWVTGHVDGTGTLVDVTRNGEAWDLSYKMPTELEPEVVQKGSICIDGVSLTVNRVWPEHFQVTLIPHTVAHTQLLEGGAGTRVNLESDIVGKYMRRFVDLGLQPNAQGGVSLETLRKAGFA